MANDVGGAEGDGSLITKLTAEPGQQQSPPPPAAPAQDPAKGNTTPPALPNWTTSASKETRADPRFLAYASKHQSLDDALKASIDLEEKIGSMVPVPGKDATPEERAAVLQKLGISIPEVPKTPAEYKLVADPKMKIDNAQLDAFKVEAHALKLTNEQAQGMFKLAGERAMKILEDFSAQTKEQTAAVEAELRKEWGKNYEAEKSLFVRGLKAAPNSAEVIADATKTGMGNRASFVRLMHWVGTLTKEDTAGGTASGAGASADPADTLYPNMKG